jgi:hypothetical protein
MADFSDNFTNFGGVTTWGELTEGGVGATTKRLINPIEAFKGFADASTKSPYWANAIEKLDSTIKMSNDVIANSGEDGDAGNKLSGEQIRDIKAERDAMQVAKIHLQHLRKSDDPSVFTDIAGGIPWMFKATGRKIAGAFGAHKGYDLDFKNSGDSVRDAGQRFAILLANAYKTGSEGNTVRSMQQVNETFKEMSSSAANQFKTVVEKRVKDAKDAYAYEYNYGQPGKDSLGIVNPPSLTASGPDINRRKAIQTEKE